MPLQSISEKDVWRLVDPSNDIRGRKLVDSRGAGHGRVNDMLIDTEDERVHSVRTDTGERFAVEPLEIRSDVVVWHDGDTIPPSIPLCGVMSVLRADTSSRVSGDRLRHAPVHAIDGEVGKLEDVYFDDRSWGVRYLVVRTSKIWLFGRKVLIAPHAIVAVDRGTRVRLKLTKNQIRHSPIVDDDPPVSRQNERMIAVYSHWPAIGTGMIPAGVAGPVVASASPDRNVSEADPHLRSAREVCRYRVYAGSGEIGHMHDLIYDFQEEAVRTIEIRTRHGVMKVTPRCVEEIRWADRAVVLHLR